MLSSGLRSLARRAPRVSSVVSSSPALLSSPRRAFSSSSSSSAFDDYDNFQFTAPENLSVEMAEGIADATQFYIRYGVANQRLKALAADETLPAVLKWQKLMEIYLHAQVHVIGGLGYAADEEGLTKFAQDLAQCVGQADPDMQALYSSVRRDTWRELVATAFGIDVDEIPSISIVDARNLMHKVSFKMVDPKVLLEIQTDAAKISDPDPQMEVAKKHQILQHVIVEKVYLGGNPSIVEEGGFGSGAAGYAKLQCAMSDYEGDPIISQYAAAAMIKVWEAAGLDLSDIQGPGLTSSEAAPVP